MREALAEWIEAASPGDRVLADNAVRLEQDIADAVRMSPTSERVRGLAAAASRKLLGELNLNAEHTKSLEASLETLLEQIPADARLLGFDEGTARRLAVEAMRGAVRRARLRLRDRILKLQAGLEGLLAVDRAKDPSTWNAESGISADGNAESLLDMSRLAEVVGTPRGVRRMPEARRDRIESAYHEMSKYLAQETDSSVFVVTSADDPPGGVPASDDVVVLPESNVCAAAQRVFDEEAARRVPLYRAARVARLELDDTYDSAQHDPWFEQFDVDALDREELASLPAVCAFATREALVGDNGAELSRLLRSGRPVHLFVRVDPLAAIAETFDGSISPLDLGYLAIGHRTTFVHQSTAARPEHFIDGVDRGHASIRPALHLVATPPSNSSVKLDPWLLVGAALEGRAHPLFTYDPSRGSTWAERFSLDGNPNPEARWTISTGDAGEENSDGDAGSAGDASAAADAFTYADYGLLHPSCGGQLRRVPEALQAEELVPVAEALTAPEEDQSRLVPFVWAVDAAGESARYVVTRRLLAACRDRLDFWRTLQELAGVQNHYVLQAIAKVRAEADAATREALDAAETAHREETERVRRDASGEVLEQLARALTSADPAELWSSAPGAARKPVAPAAMSTTEASPRVEGEGGVGAAPEEAAPEPAPAAAVAEEPWIDTPLCTSCNDCRNINSVLFVYDDSKQAYIGDPHAGTFDELVRAAEKCPARCIHPGTPLDPNEPGLDELIKRAAPFN